MYAGCLTSGKPQRLGKGGSADTERLGPGGPIATVRRARTDGPPRSG